jgi:hypothetical protein
MLRGNELGRVQSILYHLQRLQAPLALLLVVWHLALTTDTTQCIDVVENFAGEYAVTRGCAGFGFIAVPLDIIYNQVMFHVLFVVCYESAFGCLFFVLNSQRHVNNKTYTQPIETVVAYLLRLCFNTKSICLLFAVVVDFQSICFFLFRNSFILVCICICGCT